MRCTLYSRVEWFSTFCDFRNATTFNYFARLLFITLQDYLSLSCKTSVITLQDYFSFSCKIIFHYLARLLFITLQDFFSLPFKITFHYHVRLLFITLQVVVSLMPEIHLVFLPMWKGNSSNIIFTNWNQPRFHWTLALSLTIIRWFHVLCICFSFILAFIAPCLKTVTWTAFSTQLATQLIPIRLRLSHQCLSSVEVLVWGQNMTIPNHPCPLSSK